MVFFWHGEARRESFGYFMMTFFHGTLASMSNVRHSSHIIQPTFACEVVNNSVGGYDVFFADSRRKHSTCSSESIAAARMLSRSTYGNAASTTYIARLPDAPLSPNLTSPHPRHCKQGLNDAASGAVCGDALAPIPFSHSDRKWATS